VSEEACIDAFVAALESSSGGRASLAKPDKAIRDQPAVDALINHLGQRYWLEHSEVASVLNEHASWTLWGHLERLAATKIGSALPPGSWTFVPDQFEADKLPAKVLRGAIHGFVQALLATASGLRLELDPKSSVGRIDGVHWQGRLFRQPALFPEDEPAGSLSIAPIAPTPVELEVVWRSECERLRSEKLPKLYDAAKGSDLTVMLIETSNSAIVLAPAMQIAETVSSRLGSEMVDQLVLATCHHDRVMHLIDCRASEVVWRAESA
jgi:hypothetical protein